MPKARLQFHHLLRCLLILSSMHAGTLNHQLLDPTMPTGPPPLPESKSRETPSWDRQSSGAIRTAATKVRAIQGRSPLAASRIALGLSMRRPILGGTWRQADEPVSLDGGTITACSTPSYSDNRRPPDASDSSESCGSHHRRRRPRGFPTLSVSRVR